MHSPLPDNSRRRGLHPLIGLAAVCVILFCVVGAAAVLGWIPSPWARDGEAPVQAPLAQNPPAPAPAPADRASGPAGTGRGAPAPSAVAGAPAAAPTDDCASCGTVERMRQVKVAAGEPADKHRIIGTLGGGVAGGVVGNQFGGGHGKDAMTVLGAVGGALAGREIQRNMQAPPTVTRYELVVRMNNGETRTFHSEKPFAFASGDHVRVENGQLRPR